MILSFKCGVGTALVLLFLPDYKMTSFLITKETEKMWLIFRLYIHPLMHDDAHPLIADMAKLARADMLLTLHPSSNPPPHSLDKFKVKY